MTQVNNMIPAISFVGEANNVPIPPNPYMEKYLYDQSKAILEIQKESEISRINEESKMRMEDHKAALKEKQLEGMARRSFLNDLAEYSVFVNEDGGFSLIKSLPNKEQELVENILNVRHLKLVQLVSESLSEPCELLTYDNCTKFIILSADQCSPDGLQKAFRKNGIVIKLPKLSDKCIELIYAALKKENLQKPIFPYHGWIRQISGWHYVDDEETTMEDLLNGNK